MRKLVLGGSFLASLTLALACGSSSNSGSLAGNSGSGAQSDGGPGGSGANGAAAGSSFGGGSASSGVGGTAASGAGAGSANGGTAGVTGKTGVTQCTDGIDNDGDGLIDSADPECTGPLDNDESSFATGIPGDNVDPKWQDCFFDGNSGAGDDGCRYATGCLTGALSQSDANCQVTAQCQKFCMKFAPNGCDCFGCCAVQKPDGETKTIQIVGTCTIADVDDPTKCPTCVQATGCLNTCDECELCIGKDSIPASCAPPPATGGAPNTGGAAGAGGTPETGGTPNTGGAGGSYCAKPSCPAGVQSCGESCLPACPTGEYCLTGCCVTSPQ